jgi:hypothetical protein
VSSWKGLNNTALGVIGNKTVNIDPAEHLAAFPGPGGKKFF